MGDSEPLLPLELDAVTLARLWHEEEVTDLDVDCPQVDYEATAAAVLARLEEGNRAHHSSVKEGLVGGLWQHKARKGVTRNLPSDG